MTLADFQYHYGDLTFGEGTPLQVVAVDGLDGLDVRANDRPLPRGHGSVPGQHYASARDVELTLLIAEQTTELVELRVDQVRSAFTVHTDPTEATLTWKRPGVPERYVTARPFLRALPRALPAGRAVVEAKVALTCADPRAYSSERRLAHLTPFDASSGGLEYPVAEYGKEWSAPAGDVLVTNDGDADALPIMSFSGPLSAVLVTNLTTGQEFEVVATLAADQVLVADMHAAATAAPRPVIAVGTTSLYGSWSHPREPLRLVPGDNLLRYEPTGATADNRASVTWHDTWL